MGGIEKWVFMCRLEHGVVPYPIYKMKICLFTSDKQQKENNMKETIPHLALRRQWLDDVEKDPKCVWRWSYKVFSGWNPLPPGVEPSWRPNLEYSPQPKTKTYYMAMVKHKGAMASPFGLVFEKEEDIEGHLDSYALKQVGDIVPREVEQ
jgi:hypothetical protein